MTSDLVVDRLRAGPRSVTARTDAERLLRSARELAADRRLLIVRRLQVGDGEPAALRRGLVDLRDHATRATDLSAADAPAVLFDDVGAALAAFTRDLLTGVAGERWYWMPWLRRTPIAESPLFAIWQTHHQSLPAALAELAETSPELAAQAVASLAPAERATLDALLPRDWSAPRRVIAAPPAAVPLGSRRRARRTRRRRAPADAASAAAVRPRPVARDEPTPIRSHPDLARRPSAEAAQPKAARPRTPGSRRPGGRRPRASGAARRPVAGLHAAGVGRGPALRMQAAGVDHRAAARLRTGDLSASSSVTARTSVRRSQLRPRQTARNTPTRPGIPDPTPTAPTWPGALPTRHASALYLLHLMLRFADSDAGFADLARFALWVLRHRTQRHRRLRDPLWPLLLELAGEPSLPRGRPPAWWREAVDFLQQAGIAPTAFEQPGLVAHTRTHLDIVLGLAQIDIPVRLAGLDQDPGWVPQLGRIVSFHFEDG